MQIFFQRTSSVDALIVSFVETFAITNVMALRPSAALMASKSITAIITSPSPVSALCACALVRRWGGGRSGSSGLSLVVVRWCRRWSENRRKGISSFLLPCNFDFQVKNCLWWSFDSVGLKWNFKKIKPLVFWASTVQRSFKILPFPWEIPPFVD